MRDSQFDRRQFNQLTAAAFGGMVAGTMAGCGGSPPAAKGPAPESQVAAADLHTCRGLNDCKGKGSDGKNACRGMGSCANVKEHACGSLNDCKGFGGCGPDAGKNACKGKGGCHVPLMEEAWKSIRERLEAKWKEKQEKFGDAPAKVEAAKEEPKSEK